MSDLYLDHILIGIRDLGRTPHTFGDKLGFTVTSEGVHPGRGTHNRLIVFGPEYLELIAIHDQTGPIFRPNLVTFLDSREGLFIFALGTHEIDKRVDELRTRGLRLDAPLNGTRHAREDTTAYSWRQAAIDQTGTPGSQMFLIQHDQLIGERFREPLATMRHANGAVGVQHLGLAVRDAEAAASRWESAFGLSRCESYNHCDSVQRISLALKNCSLDFMSPSGDVKLAEFLDRYGEAPYELAIKVGDIAEASDYFRQREVPTRDVVDGSFLVDSSYAHGMRLLLIEGQKGESPKGSDSSSEPFPTSPFP